MKNILFRMICGIGIIMMTTVQLGAQVDNILKESLTERFQSIDNDGLEEAKGFNGLAKEPTSFDNRFFDKFRLNSGYDILDSIVYYKGDMYFKDIYSFDSHGNNTSIIFNVFDEDSNNWTVFGKFTSTFDENGNLLTKHAELIGVTDGSWMSFALQTNTYDENGNQLTSEQEGLDANSNFVKVKKKTYSYDENENRLTAIEYNWNAVTDDWESNFGGFFTYDDMGNALTAVYKLHEFSYWKILFRYKYTYDENYYLISVANNTFNAVDSMWLDNTLSSYTNDDDGIQVEALNQNFNGSEWINISKIFYSYDEFGNKIESLGHNWSNSEWVYSGRQEFTFDDNNNFLTFLLQGWNINSAEWENVLFFNYSYTNNGNLVDFSSKKWNGVEWELSDSEFWFIINEIKYTYNGHVLSAYYHTGMVGADDIVEFEACIYPNPITNGEINIEIDTYENEIAVLLYDISGRIVYGNTLQNISGDFTIFGLDNLEPGIYFLNISNGNKAKTIKVSF